jgi:hypothetical protein
MRRALDPAEADAADDELEAEGGAT